MIRQLGGLRDAVTPQFFANSDQEFSARVLLAIEMPAQIERSSRVPVERRDELLLDLGRRELFHLGGELIEASFPAALHVRFVRIFTPPRQQLVSMTHMA